MSTLREILKDTTIMKALAGDCINCRELRAEVERLKKCHAHEVQNTINALNRAEKAEAEVERLEEENKMLTRIVEEFDQVCCTMHPYIFATAKIDCPECKVERLEKRPFYLPKISSSLQVRQQLVGTDMIERSDFTENGWNWTQEAVDFIAALNQCVTDTQEKANDDLGPVILGEPDRL